MLQVMDHPWFLKKLPPQVGCSVWVAGSRSKGYAHQRITLHMEEM